ncbi:acyl carrier protein [Marinitoga sp. 1135]|uniref:Acyl carrier protein n=1 Tax=Marinitoga piezophila (strain DSM 14283 / JCM 11233 / KA3) TaxID=443254 RepID=H2J6J8_MARPK|nr:MULTISPECIES: acyl carrier protein [Marinitoga]AEX85183.1 acyl carrier protein [Marinitoga piezophila KA3]APT75676.1 acyl carrier protein [Marinitoga sp. 1137]NUU95417.1 acyl carrier protein [Marinitoga sp. 1135]NUU97344.1 acyl carrier protein [Marinitoga sp. 1138]
MDRKELFEKVAEIISESLSIDREKITEDAVLTDDLELDSLELVDLTMDFESELGISIDDSELENIKTVGDIVEILSKKAV